MPPVDAITVDAGVPAAVSGGVRRQLRGWGGGEGAPGFVVSPSGVDELADAVARARVAGACVAIARGMGRSYGDAAQLRDGVVLDTTRLKGIELDSETGIATVGAGVTIGELLDRAVPAGWMVPVVPGTQHVSVGGAVASDIHGKNHGTAGTFGTHVEALGLLTSAGEISEARAGDDLMLATLGGMGLTGVVVWARLRMTRVQSALLSVDTDRVVGLDETLAALRSPGGPHRVAWLDLLGAQPRGIVTRAEHVAAPEASGGARARTTVRARGTVRARATVPARWPAGLLRPSTVRAFNQLRFRMAPRAQRGHLESIGGHMFPLDALDAWPRLYGRPGFVQYQLAVPPDRADVLEAVLVALRRRRVPSYLAVLKDFGPANAAPLSFPLEGWTLALDLPRAAAGLQAGLDACDDLVAAAGGRVYLAKDARLRPETLRAMYPRLREWQSMRDRADPERLWCSDLALRAGLVAP